MCFVNSLCFPTNLLGLALVWLGLVFGVFSKIIVFSNESAWFGLGLAWFVCLSGQDEKRVSTRREEKGQQKP